MTRLFPAIATALILSVSLPIVAAADQTRSLTLDDRHRYDAPAAKGEPRAQTALGLRFAGHKTPQSDITAFDWFRRAAEQGDAEAQLLLSGLYATGRGTNKDYVAAYKWAYLSGLRATEAEIIVNASNMIGVLNRQMTEAEIDRAREQAVAWKATPEIVQTAATQPAVFQTASQSAPVKVELPAPVKPEPAKLASAPAAPAQAAPAPVVEAPAAAAQAKAEEIVQPKTVQSKTGEQANGQQTAAPKVAAVDKKAERRNARRAAAKSKPRVRHGYNVRYEDMVGTAISVARTYGIHMDRIHLGGWQF